MPAVNPLIPQPTAAAGSTDLLAELFGIEGLPSFGDSLKDTLAQGFAAAVEAPIRAADANLDAGAGDQTDDEEATSPIASNLIAMLFAPNEARQLLAAAGKGLPPGAALDGALRGGTALDAPHGATPLADARAVLETSAQAAPEAADAEATIQTDAAPLAAELETQAARVTDETPAQPSAITPLAPRHNDFAVHLARADAAPDPVAVALDMQATPEQPEFIAETAQHVSWLVGRGIERAEIRMNPRELGPILVEIATQNDRVDVNFAVAHPHTVHALQQTLPQLTDMLQQQGLSLGDAHVGHHGADPRGGDNQNPNPFARAAEPAEPTQPPRHTAVRLVPRGRVDDFA